ncbi:MAG: bifunctional hydroxymethylpyrimidine kinase/phosphomethylpyrimidine kinase [Verrucomicrobiota bacterium]
MQEQNTGIENMPVVLSVGASDSGGGAGIQADIKTFSALKVFGTSAITCVTAQNPEEISAIAPLDHEIVRKQIRSVCESYPMRAAKTGMLYSAEIIRSVVAADIRQGIPILVVDPVMVASSSETRVLRGDAIDALCNELLTEARVVTPNLHEAEILCGHSIASVDELRKAAQEIGDRYDVACVVKGGHLPGDDVVDVLYDEGDEQIYSAPRVNVREQHGAGCVFSAALTAYLARRELMADAVGLAKEFVRQALDQAHVVGRHRPMNFFWREAEPTSV